MVTIEYTNIGGAYGDHQQEEFCNIVHMATQHHSSVVIKTSCALMIRAVCERMVSGRLPMHEIQFMHDGVTYAPGSENLPPRWISQKIFMLEMRIK